MTNPVVHFEMPAKDRKRVSDFYSRAFGWKMVQMGQDMGNYIVAQTAETDDEGMIKTAGAINGGFFDFREDELNRAPHLVISVENLDNSIQAVEDAGGETVGQKMDIPTVGTYMSFRDSEGNIVGMLQPARQGA
jgi:uncharacterized protein